MVLAAFFLFDWCLTPISILVGENRAKPGEHITIFGCLVLSLLYFQS